VPLKRVSAVGLGLHGITSDYPDRVLAALGRA
jgi:hypothetical protein